MNAVGEIAPWQLNRNMTDGSDVPSNDVRDLAYPQRKRNGKDGPELRGRFAGALDKLRSIYTVMPKPASTIADRGSAFALPLIPHDDMSWFRSIHVSEF